MIYGAPPYKAHNDTKLNHNARVFSLSLLSPQGRVRRRAPAKSKPARPRRSHFVKVLQRRGRANEPSLPFSFLSRFSLSLPRYLFLPPHARAYPFRPFRWNAVPVLSLSFVSRDLLFFSLTDSFSSFSSRAALFCFSSLLPVVAALPSEAASSAFNYHRSISLPLSPDSSMMIFQFFPRVSSVSVSFPIKFKLDKRPCF